MMLKMILDGRSLSEILDVAAEKMGNPLAVLDISGKLIAHSTPFGVPGPPVAGERGTGLLLL